MPEREKVTKGLQCIKEGNVRCEFCGYAIDKHGHHSCQQECADDAIALLKEQEKRINELEEKLRLLEYGDLDTLQSAITPAT